MLDINLFRLDKGGNPEFLRESQRKRYANVEIVDEIIDLDKKWIKHRFNVDNFNREVNAVQAQIALLKKSGQDATELIQKKNELQAQCEQESQEMEAIRIHRDLKLVSMGNLLHDSVQIHNNEDFNKLVRSWDGQGQADASTKPFLHNEVLERLRGSNTVKGAAVAGHRGYYLIDWGSLLKQALVMYGLHFLWSKQFTLMETPEFMKKEIMAETAQLSQFEEELYKIVDGEDEKYLIATSEQPIAAYHRGDWIEPKDLPFRYGGISTCFRREAGAHGKDTLGIFRIHQFDKVEMFCYTEPENSWQMFDEMIGIAEEFYRSLGIPYRIVEIVSGALNNAAAKKYDLEAWFPASGKYRELVSCTNCTDYQSRRLEVRCGVKKMGDREKRYVHTLNSTLIAAQRALCCVLENYQTQEGLVVPEVLRPFLPGQPTTIAFDWKRDSCSQPECGNAKK